MKKEPLNEKEIEEAYLANRGDLERHITRRVRDREAAKEITHDIFLRLGRIAQSFYSPSEARFYLLRMASNLSRDHVRSDQTRARLAEGLAVLYEEPPESQESVLVRRQNVERARLALAQLSDRQKDMLRRSRILGQGYKEIAEAWHCSTSTVEQEIGRAIKAARRTVQDD